MPPHSTLSDGNKSRPAKVFGTIHQKLSETYKSLIPDSTLKANIAKRLFIPHGTINSFLKAVQKPTGRERSVGKSKGGMKVNTLPQAEKHMPAFYQIHGRCPALLVPNIIREPAVLKLHKKNCPTTPLLFLIKSTSTISNSMPLVNEIFYATRQKDNSIYRSLKEFELPENEPDILKDERIEVICKLDKEDQTLQMRRVAIF